LFQNIKTRPAAGNALSKRTVSLFVCLCKVLNLHAECCEVFSGDRPLSTLIMEAQTVSETFCYDAIFTQLIARENFICFLGEGGDVFPALG
jgi:hypothetical protein